MSLPAQLADVTQADIDALISTGAQEGQQLDFKRDFPAQWSDSAKAKLVADVIAFANAGGGDVIYGVDEDTEARASKVVPQTLANVDQQVRTIQQIAQDQTEPRVAGVEVRAIPVAVGEVTGHVVVVRIRQSWAAPHRSRMNNHFHVREGVRNRPLDVPEVGAMFLRAESLGQKLRDFRSDRLAKIVSGQAPVSLGGNPKLVVLAIPTQAAVGQAYIDPVPYLRRERKLPTLDKHTSASSIAMNFDGAVAPLGYSGQPDGYTQQFRQGFFETVWELAVLNGQTKPGLPGLRYEEFVIFFLEGVRGQLKASGLSLELAVFVSLLGANETVMHIPSSMGWSWGHENKVFDRQDILLPEVLIPADVSIGKGMRPAFDLMCQAAGAEGSANYGEDGEWKKPSAGG
ncbi:helix-turn-helix domain-containing protein [Roseateles sp.]|uniref:AlbA family DNA-binding domain-containing protein n=1 Tax=Roseateles sp. TaxID=1971397 RepID=UPI0025F7E52E|nr:ATP-binding protein [Roseateles sp.]MBV8036313.1 ATP-binding protein [Roseateles sp.]